MRPRLPVSASADSIPAATASIEQVTTVADAGVRQLAMNVDLVRNDHRQAAGEGFDNDPTEVFGVGRQDK